MFSKLSRCKPADGFAPEWHPVQCALKIKSTLSLYFKGRSSQGDSTLYWHPAKSTIAAAQGANRKFVVAERV